MKKRTEGILLMIFMLIISGCGICPKITREGKKVSWIGINTFNPEDKCGNRCKKEVEVKGKLLVTYKNIIDNQSVELQELKNQGTSYKAIINDKTKKLDELKKEIASLESNNQKDKRLYESEIERLKKQIEKYKEELIKIKNNIVHVVVKGESLSKLALFYYESFKLWPLIYWANPDVEDPDLIYIGQRISIPYGWNKQAKDEAVDWFYHCRKYNNE